MLLSATRMHSQNPFSASSRITSLNISLSASLSLQSYINSPCMRKEAILIGTEIRPMAMTMLLCWQGGGLKLRHGKKTVDVDMHPVYLEDEEEDEDEDEDACDGNDLLGPLRRQTSPLRNTGLLRPVLRYR